MNTVKPPSNGKVRVRVFVDYWNFQLTLNQKDGATRGERDTRFAIDWRKLGPWLAGKACEIVGVSRDAYSFDGVSVYASFNPSTPEGKTFRNWVTSWLDRQPGVDAKCLERKPKSVPRCPSCH
ncbi:MAG: hypothetical protein ACRETT_08455 [Steroidobacteraceae bacterium]